MNTRCRFAMNENRLRHAVLLGLLFFCLISLVLPLSQRKSTPIREFSLSLTPRSMAEVYEDNLQLEAALLDLKNQLSDIYARLDSTLSEEEFLREELEYFRLSSGYRALEGEGVTVLVTDSRDPLMRGQNPNTQLVHDADLNILVSELRNAGAEAISVNGERVLVHHTRMICNGPTIRINERVYSQPFLIEAIGPRKDLLAAVYAADGYTQLLRRSGIFVEANTSILLQVPAFEETLAMNYLQEVRP